MAINENAVTDTLTPTTGTLTVAGAETIQTLNLIGGNSNLISYSQLIGGGNWTNGGTSTSTQNTAVAPDSTTTASTITGANGTTYASNVIRIGITVTANTTYVFSCYIQAGTATAVGLGARDNSLGTDTLTSFTPTASWQRFSATFTTGSTASTFNMYLGGANGTFYAWGAQVNPGSSATTYLATTANPVYSYPYISFNGNVSVEMDGSGNLILQPSGTGALQAQQTTSSAVGGNARGANAVDWQTARNSAGQVASGIGSVIVGGSSSTASGTLSVAGGTGSIASGSYTFVGSGYQNSATQSYAGSVVGYQNQATGWYNFIGGGAGNIGTLNGTVTTQATTTVTSGSTAVTLSGSNASIKVGQIIRGTGMVDFTYVSAISGTSLTLSQNANASGSPTLSFYTPHGVVVGGGNNQATGSYSFVGGGGDAGTSSQRNVASGDWSFVGGGWGNQATAVGAVVVGGGQNNGLSFGNSASNTSAFVGAGVGNQASGSRSSVVGGYSNWANADYAAILGGIFGIARSIIGNQVAAACNNPMGTGSLGTQQSALLILARQTTDATPTVLASNTSAASGTNQVILPNNSAYYVVGTIIAGVTGGGNTSAWNFVGAIKRGATAGSTAIVGTGITATLVSQDAGASGWAVSITADTTNGGLAVTVTGQASTTIRWVCKVETTEMTY